MEDRVNKWLQTSDRSENEPVEGPGLVLAVSEAPGQKVSEENIGPRRLFCASWCEWLRSMWPTVGQMLSPRPIWADQNRWGLAKFLVGSILKKG